MANTYTQIHLQFVFATKFRTALIEELWEDELFKYITGITQSPVNKHKMLAINGMPDHIHFLVGFRPHRSISDFIQEIKSATSRWINERKLAKDRFEWQTGYGAFSSSKNDIEIVIRYIQNQKEHHKKKTFMQEYLEFLKEFNIEYDERYVFQPLI